MTSTTAEPSGPDSADFSATRTRTDGKRTRWIVVTSARGVTIARQHCDDNQAWVEVSTHTAPTLTEAITADAELLILRADEQTAYTTPDPDSLLDALVLDSPGSDPWDIEWVIDTDDLEAEDGEFQFEAGHVSRFAHVNGQRVHFIDTETGHVAITADDYPTGAEQIAELIWNNGGDPATGQLLAVRPGVAIGLERSESRQEVFGYRYDQSPAAIATMLQQWLVFANGFGNGAGAAAVALEDFDPNSTLTAQQRQDWDDVLWEQKEGWDYTFRITFDVPAPVKEALRRQFATDPNYVAVRDALAAPTAGAWLREQLAEGITEAVW